MAHGDRPAVGLQQDLGHVIHAGADGEIRRAVRAERRVEVAWRGGRAKCRRKKGRENPFRAHQMHPALMTAVTRAPNSGLAMKSALTVLRSLAPVSSWLIQKFTPGVSR